MVKHKFDVVIVGAGGAGLRAAVEIPKQYSVAVITKVFPSRSHTGAAQGGVCAALGNEEEDNSIWHTFDTIKGGDYLTDQDAALAMCTEAPEAIIELEHMGLPFSRTKEGKIAQRFFGGHTRDFGKAPVRRSCYSADRTGHVMLHTLFENAVKRGVTFFSEFVMLDVVRHDDKIVGVIALDITKGELHVFQARSVIFATGGLGRAFKTTSNALSNTGDGMAIAMRNGIPMEDMEFVQFHPTGLVKIGVLVSEAARGEGGILLNNKGERFMERIAPTVKDLAPRDMVARSMITEIREGRGFEWSDGSPYIKLDLTHLGAEKIEEKLPDIAGFSRTYLGIDPVKEPIPVHPTTHYAMGGIPTNIDTEVLFDEKGSVVKGFYAAGECACVSVHGANRLGTNSLLDLVVFGRRAGRRVTEYLSNTRFEEIHADEIMKVENQIDHAMNNEGTQSLDEIRQTLQREMMDKVSVFREKEGMTEAIEIVKDLKQKLKNVRVRDRSKVFNMDLMETLEMSYTLDVAEVIAVCALNREESRGAHSRVDFAEDIHKTDPDFDGNGRNDKKWMKHTFCFSTKDESEYKIKYKPVNMLDFKEYPEFKPKERKY
jgi:succinate dehydrogenase / fumarate reductase, flavoprotein subunit